MNTYIYDNKKFDTTTSEILAQLGSENAMCAEDGQVTIYKTKKGTFWGTFKYWPNSFGAQNVTHFVGEESCKVYLTRRRMTTDMEKIFGPLEEA